MSSALPVVVSEPCVSIRAVPFIATPVPTDKPVAYLFSADEGAPGAMID
jgi:hypothetical protein